MGTGDPKTARLTEEFLKERVRVVQCRSWREVEQVRGPMRSERTVVSATDRSTAIIIITTVLLYILYYYY